MPTAASICCCAKRCSSETNGRPPNSGRPFARYREPPRSCSRLEPTAIGREVDREPISGAQPAHRVRKFLTNGVLLAKRHRGRCRGTDKADLDKPCAADLGHIGLMLDEAVPCRDFACDAADLRIEIGWRDLQYLATGRCQGPKGKRSQEDCKEDEDCRSK